jgi:poly(hydroxyalkanoate) granule-associated protein
MIRRARDIQAGVTQSAYKIWLAGLGAVAYAQEGGEKLFVELVKRGREMEAHVRLSPPEMTRALRGAADRGTTAVRQLNRKIDDQVTAALHRIGVPTRQEIATLTKRMELLTASVEKLKPRARAVAKDPAKT